MMNNIAININTEKDANGNTLKKIIKVIKEKLPKCNVIIFKDCENVNQDTMRDIDLMISLGGDGTILNTSRKVSQFGIPIFGVNLGHLGFLTSTEVDEFSFGIENLKNGNYLVEERNMLKCQTIINGEKRTFYCLNDLVISKSTLSKIIKCSISIDNNYFNEYNGDGILISTPTGSTAYSLSCGGPIIYPILNVMSISPICAHTLNARSIVVDGNSNITIDIKRKKGSVCINMDGQEAYEFKEDIHISVTSAPWKCKIIRLKSSNYFEILRKKILFRT